MSKFKIVFYKGPPVVLEGSNVRFNESNHMLELIDDDGKVVAGFGQFQYWQKLEDAE